MLFSRSAPSIMSEPDQEQDRGRTWPIDDLCSELDGRFMSLLTVGGSMTLPFRSTSCRVKASVPCTPGSEHRTAEPATGHTDDSEVVGQTTVKDLFLHFLDQPFRQLVPLDGPFSLELSGGRRSRYFTLRR